MPSLPPSRLALVAGLTLFLAASAINAEEKTCEGALPSLTCVPAQNPSGASMPELHVQDGFLSDEEREDLIKYLDSHEPTNPLGVIMVPAPRSLADRFLGALRRLGAGSAHEGRFPELRLSAFAGGAGRLPGKSVGAGSKGCHADFEVDSGFNIDNVVGPTEGRVGIVYLSGEGEFVLVDEETGKETRQEVKPGRFLSWRNTGNRHCLATASEEPRRFLGPVVLDASKEGFIPVVDILAGPAKTCKQAADCSAPNPACVDNLCCTPAGGAAIRNATFCCPGSILSYPSTKCCYVTGSSASAKEQCCSGRLIDNVCAPTGSLKCVAKCELAAEEEYLTARAACEAQGGSRLKVCKKLAKHAQALHKAYCYGANLPNKCFG